MLKNFVGVLHARKLPSTQPLIQDLAKGGGGGGGGYGIEGGTLTMNVCEARGGYRIFQMGEFRPAIPKVRDGVGVGGGGGGGVAVRFRPDTKSGEGGGGGG